MHRSHFLYKSVVPLDNSYATHSHVSYPLYKLSKFFLMVKKLIPNKTICLWDSKDSKLKCIIERNTIITIILIMT